MNIVLDARRHIIVDNQINILNIKPSAGNISGQKNVRPVNFVTINHVSVLHHLCFEIRFGEWFFEISIDVVSIVLSFITMDSSNFEVHLRADHVVVP